MSETTHCIDAEIFSTGEWNGERFTRRDLHEIARNFRLLRGQLHPPLKFGHDEGQTLLGQGDGDPALGWVQRLWVRGDRLLARFVDVPGLVLEAIRAGRYRRVSAELYFDVRRGGRRLGKALKAVALLGADLPAVTNLNDLTAYLASRAESVAAAPPAEPFAAAAVRSYALPTRAGRIVAPDPPTPEPEERAMSELETLPLESLPDVQAELAELRAYKERAERRGAEERQRRSDAAFQTTRAEALAFCEAQVAAGRLPPHLHERLRRELEGQARTFSAGQPLRVSFDWVRRHLEAAPALLPMGEAAHAAPPDAGGRDDENPSRALARLAGNAMTELNLSYGEAAAYVLRTQPALARAYRDYTVHPS
jgi:hypothetical protein